MNPDKMCDSLLQGMQEAQKNYFEMSNGWWLCSGAEYFLTSNLATHLHFTDPQRVFCTVEESLQSFSFGRGRRNHALRMGGRADIAVWDGFENPIGIVEVKVQKSVSTCGEDLDRLTTFASKTLGLAAFVYYRSFSEPTPDRVAAMANRRLDSVSRSVNEYAEYCELSICSRNHISEAVDDRDMPKSW